MKNKLEDILGYIPYNLEGLNKYENYYILDPIDQLEITNTINLEGFLNEMTPLLYPNDISREIIFEGEKLIPSVWFRDNYQIFNVTKDDMIQLISMYCHVFTRSDSAPYWFIKKLYEWKIDVNNLIPFKSALDKNDYDNKI